MINKSLSLLNTVVKTLVENERKVTTTDDGPDGPSDDADAATEKQLEVVPYRQSKLTHLLRDAFGGSFRTTLILTGSPASYNISETFRTMKFGRYCRSVQNSIRPSVEMSPADYRKIFNDSQKKQGELVKLVNELSAECFQLKQDAKKSKFVEAHYEGPLWDTIESVLVNNEPPLSALGGGKSAAAFKVAESKKGGAGPDDADAAALREELANTKDELSSLRAAHSNLENLLAERQSEVAVLRTQNDTHATEKKRDSEELATMRNEIRMLTQRKQEVEHNLRTSQFREYEATVFLRQFRRFYRRLLRNKAHQGTGKTSEVIERVPGVPDLNDLIDVDSLLLEAGLIEESELHDDTATGAYRPSAQALGRSTDAASKAWKEAALHGKTEELESFDRSNLEGQRRGSSKGGGGDAGADAGAGAAATNGQLIAHRQQFLGTPSGRLTTMRERELERDLLRATERCIELQVSLNEEKANVDILTNRAGNLNKKKFAQESIQLKQQLDKKTHDLQAIIWKMNELHLINKTYNEKMSNREQHVTYLEENLVELQSSNRNMILERQEAEGELRGELDNLKVLVDAMTVPLWQFGESGITGRTLASRIRLPVCVGEYDNKKEDDDANDDGEESLESLDDSDVSYVEEDDDSEYEDETDAAEAPAVQAPLVPQNTTPMRDAATQTITSTEAKGTMTDSKVTQMPPRVMPQSDAPVIHKTSSSNQLREQEEVHRSSAISTGDVDPAADHKMTRVLDYSNGNDKPGDSYLFIGGKPAGSQPRRFVHKFGLMIRPGVLKESPSKSKSERSSRSTKI